MAEQLPTRDSTVACPPRRRSAHGAPGDIPLSRRGFVSAATWSLVTRALLGAGGGGEPTSPGDPPSGGNPPGGTNGITINGNVITIAVAQVPELAAAEGFRLVQEARAVVINVGNNTFRAFTSVCTHQRCDVSSYSSGRLVCPCHNSQFDNMGRVVRGPATAPLAEFPTSYNASTRTLTVTKQ